MSTRLGLHHSGAPVAVALVLLTTTNLAIAETAGDPPGEPAAGSDLAGQIPVETLDATLAQELPADPPPRVGEVVTLTATLTHPAGALVSAPGETGKPRWQIVDARTTKGDGSSNDGAHTTTKVELDLMSWRPGSSTLPALTFTVVSLEGESIEVKSEPVEVKVLTSLGADEVDPSFSSARPPVPIYEYDYGPLYWGGGAGALALVGLLGFALARRRMQAAKPEPPPPPIHEVALARLGELSTSDLSTPPEFVLFYIRLSEVVREYLGKRFDFPGTELTTTEIMDRLGAIRWPSGLAPDDVRQWLEFADRVKFTAFTPERSDASASLRRAFSFVELTRNLTPVAPEPEPEPEVEEDGEAKAEHEVASALGTTALGGFSFEEAARLAAGEDLDGEGEEE